MAIKLDPEQIKQLKDQLAEANRNSHFVIISAFSKKEHSNIDMVTDWRNYLNMKENNGDNFDFSYHSRYSANYHQFGYWAVAQQNLHTITTQGDQDDQAVNDLEFYTNKVMEEIKCEFNIIPIQKEQAFACSF